MSRRVISITVILEPIGGTALFLLVLWIWLRIFLDPSTVAKGESFDVLGSLMLVGPVLLVVTGSYLQAFRATRWPAVLVLLGGVWNLLVVGINVLFGFLWFADSSGLRAVFADLLLAIFTMALACVNVVRNDPYLFAKGTVGQIVGPERGERVSRLD